MIEWVFDIHKKDKREVKEKLLSLQQEKDSVSLHVINNPSEPY